MSQVDVSWIVLKREVIVISLIFLISFMSSATTRINCITESEIVETISEEFSEENDSQETLWIWYLHDDYKRSFKDKLLFRIERRKAYLASSYVEIQTPPPRLIA